MSKLKQYKFWICVALCLAAFAGTYPYYHDIYMSEVHTGICICLNAFSSLLFSAFLYCKWMNCLGTGRKTIFLILTILQAAGHGIFAIMNWGSFFFLPMSVIAFVVLVLSYFKKQEK